MALSVVRAYAPHLSKLSPLDFKFVGALRAGPLSMQHFVDRGFVPDDHCGSSVLSRLKKGGWIQHNPSVWFGEMVKAWELTPAGRQALPARRGPEDLPVEAHP